MGIYKDTNRLRRGFSMWTSVFVDCVEKIAFESPHRTPGLRNTSLVLAA